MNLPHQEPLIFAKKILQEEGDFAKVLCEFKSSPTLAMFLEASAQSTIAFSSSKEVKTGFLVNAQNVKLIEKLEELEYVINIKKEVEVNNMKKFFFEAFGAKSNLITTRGNITIVIQD